MSASDEEARGVAGITSPATKPRDRVRLDIHLLGTNSSGSDDDLSATERRGTPHDTSEGLDQDSPRSDHSNHHHTPKHWHVIALQLLRCAARRETVSQSVTLFIQVLSHSPVSYDPWNMRLAAFLPL